MSNLIDAVRGRRVNPLWGVAIVVGMPLVILFVGLLSLEATFRFGATTVNKDGEIVYANQINLRGWEAVPFQAIAALIGSGATAYGAYKVSSKLEVAKQASEPPEQ